MSKYFNVWEISTTTIRKSKFVAQQARRNTRTIGGKYSKHRAWIWKIHWRVVLRSSEFFPWKFPVKALVSPISSRIRASARGRAPCATWPIFFRQYWPSRRSGGGTKISADFVLSPPVGTELDIPDEWANPQRSTWRVDFAAELSGALKALSPLGRRSRKFEIYILRARRTPRKTRGPLNVDCSSIRPSSFRVGEQKFARYLVL